MKAVKNGKIVIIGAGHVGSHCGLSLMMQGLADEIVYIDIKRQCRHLILMIWPLIWIEILQ